MMARPDSANQPDEPGDAFLIESMLAGDGAALRRLMDRYDRLVRYTVFRSSKRLCTQDPQWLDSVASSTWLGFVRAMRRSPEVPPRSVAAFLVQIARRQAATAARPPSGQAAVEEWPLSDDLACAAGDAAPANDVAVAEALEALRGCLASLDEDDRTLVSQLTAIVERRWLDAAAALGLQESTLRSRWKRVLDRLRRCLGQRGGEKAIAPTAGSRDR